MPASSYQALAGKLGQRQRLVEMLGPPGQQFFCQGEADRAISRIVGEIVAARRIGLEIEKQRRQASEVDVFEALLADYGHVDTRRRQPEPSLRFLLGDAAEVELPMH